jgi:hypothetical protein
MDRLDRSIRIYVMASVVIPIPATNVMDRLDRSIRIHVMASNDTRFKQSQSLGDI